MTEKFTVEKCMTQCVTLCMTQNMGATLLKIGVYDTKMYDTKCKTISKTITVNKMGLTILRGVKTAPENSARGYVRFC